MRGTCRRAWQLLRYRRRGGYRAADYWSARHARYGFDLRGVGNETLADEQNRADYDEARQVFRDLCRGAGVDLAQARMLDIGCGTGFYCETYVAAGGRDYTGVDITDALFDELRRRHPPAHFVVCDVTAEELPGTYDLITMIDVTQHIVEDDRFAFAMSNTRRHLEPGGTVVLTSWLSRQPARRTFYEVERTLAAYEAAFEGWTISKPVPFRDKYIFSVRS